MVEGPYRVALVTVIGDGVLDDVERIPSSALVGAEGFCATPRVLSLAVPEGRGPEVLRAVHRALVEKDRKEPPRKESSRPEAEPLRATRAPRSR